MAVATTWLRLEAIDVPLERDEGEYAYMGQLLRDGVPPYRLASNMKWPGTYAAYAAIMAIFGESVQGIRIGMIVVTSITAVLVFVLARRLFGDTAAAVAAGAQLLFSVSQESLALFGHATHFVALCATAGFLLLTGKHPAAAYAAGVVLGLAPVMKQPGIFFAAAAVLLLAVKREWKQLGLVIAGGLTALAAMLATLHVTSVFDRFWFWTVEYAREYGNAVSWAAARKELAMNAGLIFRAAPLLWILAGAGVLLVRRSRLLLFAFLGAGALSVIPGFHFRAHYFITMFPAAALFAGAAVAESAARFPRSKAVRFAGIALAAVALYAAFSTQRTFLKNKDRNELSRSIYGPEPFPEARAVGEYLRAHTAPADRIAVLGSEPEIYFYANRRSATGYLYAYPLMEPQKFATRMQQEMIREITSARPKYLVIVNVGSSWGSFPESDRTILEWMWSRPHSIEWQIEGVADMRSHPTRYVFGDEARTFLPTTAPALLIVKRRDS